MSHSARSPSSLLHFRNVTVSALLVEEVTICCPGHLVVDHCFTCGMLANRYLIALLLVFASCPKFSPTNDTSILYSKLFFHSSPVDESENGAPTILCWRSRQMDTHTGVSKLDGTWSVV